MPWTKDANSIKTSQTTNSRVNVDLDSISLKSGVSVKSGASTRPPSRLSSKSGSVILVTRIGDEDRIGKRNL